jgi:MerR family transcriptional regulator, light-induced transcriptional regulator
MMSKSRDTRPPAPGAEPALLSISEVAARTGIPETLLRTWESRYGVPQPERSRGGRRRYRASDCELLLEVQRWRTTGLPVAVAIAHAQRAVTPIGPSIFATTRRLHPEVAAHRLPKRALLALSHAIEDDSCAGALRPLLVGAFQRPEFYEASRLRWSELARTAELAVVLAEFGGPPQTVAGPVLVNLAHDATMVREWAVVCYAADRGALLSGWELPGQETTADRARRFEVLWSVDQQVVRDAVLAAARLVESAEPGLSVRLRALAGDSAPAPADDLRRAAGLLDRTLDYLWA